MLRTLLLFTGLVLVYSAFLTRTYYWDGVLFSLYIEQVYNGELPRSVLFHPNHLLYSPFGYLLYSFSRNLGLPLRAITLLQGVNIFASAGAAALIFTLVKRRCLSTVLAVFCSVLFAFGATWWKFSTDANSYILSVFLLLAAISFALDETRGFLLPAVCHSLAMLFHELAVFAYVPVLTAILLANRPKSTRIRQAVAYILGTASCVALAYRLAYRSAGLNDSRTFLGWVTSFSAESQMTHSWRQILIGYPASYLKLLGGGKLSLIRDYLSLPVIAALLVSVAALLVGIWLMQYPKREIGVSVPRRTVMVLWAWMLPYLLFFTWWEPGSAFYKLFVWSPIVLLLGCFVAERSSSLSRAKAWIAFSAALAAWNFGAFIFPHSRSSADPVLALAETINRELPKNATVYYKVLSPDDWYLQYFAPGRRWLPLPDGVNLLSDTGSRPICFETTALESLHAQINSSMKWEIVNGKHNTRLLCR